VPVGPEIGFLAPHGRERLSASNLRRTPVKGDDPSSAGCLVGVQALLLDLNGVLYDKPNRAIPGAGEALKWARRGGLPIRFVTNTATRSAKAIREGMVRLGFALEQHELVTAPLAAQSWIKERGLRPHALVHPAIADVFDGLGAGPPDCVVLGDAREGLTYDALNQAFRLVLDGAPLIGIGLNRCFREAGQWMLDAGPFTQAIAWAAEVNPLIMGKPSAAFYEQVVAELGLKATQCLMVGDDVEADVAAAVDAGLQAALVRTGKYRARDEERCPAGVHVIDSIAALPRLQLRV